MFKRGQEWGKKAARTGRRNKIRQRNTEHVNNMDSSHKRC